MNTRVVGRLCLLACVWSVAAVAQEAPSGTAAPSAAARKAPAELEQIKRIVVGKFACTGRNYVARMGRGRATRLTVTGTPELDGFWYLSVGQEDKTAENPRPAKFREAFGYDSVKKKFVAIGIDNAGGHSMETSDGPAGERIVYTGTYTIIGNDLSIRDTYSATGHIGEVQSGGEWRKVDEETCKRK